MDTVFAMPAGATPYDVDLLSSYKAQSGQVLAGVTIGRIRLQMSPTAAVGVGTQLQTIHWGLQIDDASRTAATLADPFNQPYADWMINMVDWVDTTSIASPKWASPESSYVRDLRTKRKIHGLTDTLWMSVYPLAYNGSTSLNIAVHANILLLLP